MSFLQLKELMKLLPAKDTPDIIPDDAEHVILESFDEKERRRKMMSEGRGAHPLHQIL